MSKETCFCPKFNSLLREGAWGKLENKEEKAHQMSNKEDHVLNKRAISNLIFKFPGDGCPS